MSNSNFQHYDTAAHIRHHKNKRIMFGAFIILAGIFILAKKIGVPFIHYPIWPIVLIVVGIVSGIKHNFRRPFSWILILIGTLHLIPRFTIFGILSTHFIFPIILMGVGLYVIFKPKRNLKHCARFNGYRRERFTAATIHDEDSIALDVAFGERTNIITSKQFKGGTIDASFGNAKVNLLQAEGETPITIDVNISFGGLEIYVPSHWDIVLEIDDSFASVEDKRYIRTQAETPMKLILTGKCSFGSVTVKSI